MRYINHLASLFSKGSPFLLGKEVTRDFFGRHFETKDNAAHIAATIEWLLEAQRANSDGGVSAMYSLYEGWHASYSETTGYIIPTIFNYFHQTKRQRLKECALRMAEWELTRQFKEGAFPGGASNGREFPIVFNTGQVIFGMVRAYEETKDERFRDSAQRAAKWLISCQNEKGNFIRNEYLDEIHTYNTRTALAMLRAHQITDDDDIKAAAQKNLDWALTQQRDNGWFANNAFQRGQEPLLHTISYAIEGLLWGGIYLKEQKYLDAAQKTADSVLGKQREDGSLAGSFDENWNSKVTWSCLTGNAQISLVWLQLHALTKKPQYLEAAHKANEFNKSTQNLNARDPGIKGGIKGAYPIYGWYAPFCYINWAAKFFVDALMAEQDPKVLRTII